MVGWIWLICCVEPGVGFWWDGTHYGLVGAVVVLVTRLVLCGLEGVSFDAWVRHRVRRLLCGWVVCLCL